jgi:hypothetical protein
MPKFWTRVAETPFAVILRIGRKPGIEIRLTCLKMRVSAASGALSLHYICKCDPRYPLSAVTKPCVQIAADSRCAPLATSEGTRRTLSRRAIVSLNLTLKVARHALAPITFRLHETIGGFIASDYVSKRATRNNRQVLAAQKGRFVDYHWAGGSVNRLDAAAISAPLLINAVAYESSLWALFASRG